MGKGRVTIALVMATVLLVVAVFAIDAYRFGDNEHREIMKFAGAVLGVRFGG